MQGLKIVLGSSERQMAIKTSNPELTQVGMAYIAPSAIWPVHFLLLLSQDIY